MFKRLIVVSIITFVVCLSGRALAYSGGTGTPTDPYQIAGKDDLFQLAGTAADYDKFFIMMADIDLAGETFATAVIAPDTNTATADFQGSPFSGVFDGNGHAISNLRIDAGMSGNDYLGLMGSTSQTGVLKNLAVENVVITGIGGSENCGGLIGRNRGTVQYCHSSGSIGGQVCVGGLVGRSDSGSMTRCYSSAQVVASVQTAGGLTGVNNSPSTMTECWATGNVTAVTSTAGGLEGTGTGAVRQCYATGNVSAGVYAGGLIGICSGVNQNCYATGSVSGGDYLGGMWGYLSGASLKACYSTGYVSAASHCGGMAGRVGSATGTGGYFWDTQTSGRSTSYWGTGKMTWQMKTMSTFTGAGWDFVGEATNGTYDYWQMAANSYPSLTFQGLVATPVLTPAGGMYDDETNVVITCATAGATIHYTTNGQDPNESDPVVLSGASVSVGGNLTLKARAWKSAMAPSAIATEEYTLWPDANIIIGTGTSTWQYPMHAGRYVVRTQTIYVADEIGAPCDISSLSLYITYAPSPMDNFTIRLRHTDLAAYGSSGWESTGWTTVYQANQTISTTGWVKFNFAAPFDYNGSQNLMVDISFRNSNSSISDAYGYCQYSTPGGIRSLYVAIGPGTDPLTWSGLGPLPNSSTAVTNLKLEATFAGVKNLKFSPPAGTYDSEQNVTVTCATTDATIHYTTNGMDPNEDDPVVVVGSSIYVDHSLTLKTRAWKAGVMTRAVMSAFYDLVVAEPSFSDYSGAYGGRLDVVIACATPGATIHYTTNGADPTESDPVIASGASIPVDHSLTLKVKAWKSGFTPSPVQSASYTIIAGNMYAWGSNNYGQATPPSGIVMAIAAGDYYSLALKADGSIVGWGYNYYGQATPPSGMGYVAIAAGDYHSLALRADGSIVAWGANDYGQATPPSGAGFTAIAGGEYHSLALRGDGSIAGWGDDYFGQATPPSGTDFVAIAAGEIHSLALRADGSIVGWGDNTYGQGPPPSGQGFVAIAAGAYHSLALRADGSIVGWGRNFDGQATPPSGTGFVAIAAGEEYSLALKADGSIVAWGSNRQGQATPPSGRGFLAIAAGDYHGLAIRNMEPLARAGADQTLHADHTGKVTVKLDGGASSDPENDPLTYRWSWRVADANYTSTEPNFTTTLPIGIYTFTLVVSDGLSDSEPNTCTVNVVAPVDARLMMVPRVLNAQAHNKDIAAIFTIPSITKADLDPAAPITLWPFGIEAKRKMVFAVRDGLTIMAFFDAADIIAATPRTSFISLQVETKLRSGRYAVGSDYVFVLHPPKRRL